MANILVRNVPQDLHKWLTDCAHADRSSMQQVIIDALMEYRTKRGEIEIRFQKGESK